MENKSLTQEQLTNELIERDKKHKEFIQAVKDNINYIYIALMIIFTMLLSLCKIENNSISFNLPTTSAGWVLWVLQLLFYVISGVSILNGFRRQGIRMGKKLIEPTYKEYLSALDNPIKSKTPKSEKQYMRSEKNKDILSKSLTFSCITFLTGQLLISWNLNNLLTLVMNLIIAIAFGIKDMFDAETYVVTELVTWYKLEIERLKIKKEDKKDGTKQQMPRTRHAKSSRVQQEKERGTRQNSSELKPTSNSNS